MFKIKYNVDDSLQHHKAHIVTKRFHEQPSFDYSETFSLVVQQTTIHIVLIVALSCYWSIHQININNNFLYGDLGEMILMVQPPRFETTDRFRVCKLHKVIYGLKQAPRSWFHNLTAILSSFGFSSTKSDSLLFVKFHKSYTMMILIYIDDIIITRTSSCDIQALISFLHQHFALKYLRRFITSWI